MNSDTDSRPLFHYGEEVDISKLDRLSKKRYISAKKFFNSKNELDDFSKVEYLTTNINVVVICKNHGKYKVSPHNYMYGYRCPLCSNNRRLTEEEFLQKVKDKFGDTIKIISKFKGLESPITYKCTDCGHEDTVKANVLLKSKHGCKICSNIRKTQGSFEKEIAEKHPNLIVLDKYINNCTPIRFQCKDCGDIRKATPYSILFLKGKACPTCSKKDKSERRKLSEDEVKRRLKEKHNGEITLIKYTSIHKDCSFRCEKCGYEWDARGGSVINDGSGCPQCKNSKGEKEVGYWLKSHNIEYEIQKTFDDCKNVNYLPYDFYIPSKGVLIEYNGVQHYEPTYFSKKLSKDYVESQFRYRQRLDNIKRSYAKENYYTLIEIPYNKPIEDYLTILL